MNSRVVATVLAGVALASFFVWTRHGLKFYRLHQEDGDHPVFVGEQGPGRITRIEWDQGTVNTSLIESEWFKPYVHYDATTSLGDGLSNDKDVYFHLVGSVERNGNLQFEYIGIDHRACGLKISVVSHFTPPDDEDVTKVDLQLLP